jgi:hypothetical protein
MKSKILTISILCFSKILFAQDSLRVETVVDTAFKTPQYIAAYDDVFLSHKETKWLLKADLMGALGGIFDYSNGLRPSSIELERKIGKEFSLNVGLSMPLDLVDVFDNNPQGDRVTSLTYIVEPRYFFGKNKSVLNSPVTNNLNGNYISLRAGITQNFLRLSNDGSKGFTPELKMNKRQLALNYGMQRRVFNHFYVNYKIGLSMSDLEILTGQVEYSANFVPPYPISRRKTLEVAYGFDNQFTVGLAFGGGKKTIANNSCDLFRCFEEEQQLFKIDVKELLGRFDNRNISSKIMLGYEKKLGKSSFSINTEFSGKFAQNKDNDFSPWKGVLGLGRFDYGYEPTIPSAPNPLGQRVFNTYKYYNASLTVEPRFYYNLKRRIAKGKSANNLSGSYIALAFVKGFDFDQIPNTTLTIDNQLVGNTLSHTYFLVTPRWGHQRRLFKNGFMDFSISPLWQEFSSIKTEKGRVINSDKRFLDFNELKADFKIGFAF